MEPIESNFTPIFNLDELFLVPGVDVNDSTLNRFDRVFALELNLANSPLNGQRFKFVVGTACDWLVVFSHGREWYSGSAKECRTNYEFLKDVFRFAMITL
jgi:hypothetical protein